MLADSRSRRRSSAISRRSGCYLRNLQAVAPDVNAFPMFDDNLRQAFQHETELFLESQLREDRSVVDLLTANYTFVNERLARHYGIPNVYGSHFRRVTLPDGRRGGPARPRQHSDRHVICDADLAGPPRQVAAREHPRRAAAAAAAQRAGSARGRGDDGQAGCRCASGMEQHRSNPVCASCHAQMDPLGFALENFDAIGRWRTVSEADTPIDASGALPDGAKFDGPAELRQLLACRVATVRDERSIEKLLIYALGRGLEYYDMPAVRRSCAKRAAAGLPLVVAHPGNRPKSTPFQMRRSEP